MEYGCGALDVCNISEIENSNLVIYPYFVNIFNLRALWSFTSPIYIHTHSHSCQRTHKISFLSLTTHTHTHSRRLSTLLPFSPRNLLQPLLPLSLQCGSSLLQPLLNGIVWVEVSFIVSPLLFHIFVC